MRFLLLLSLLYSASATTRYISATGNDANSCTTGSRCKSINAAFQLSANGDTILVQAGTYSDVQELRSNGTSGANNLLPIGANVVTIQPESGSVTFSNEVHFSDASSGTPVRHMWFKGGITFGDWVNIKSGSDIHFSNVHMGFQQWNCLDYGSIQASEVGPATTSFGDGIDFYGAAYGSTCNAAITHVGNWLVEDSTIHGFSTDDPTAHPDAIALDDGDTVTLRRNSFYNNCGDDLRMAVGLNGVTNSVIENNYFGPQVSCAAGAATTIQVVGVGMILRYNTIDGAVQTVTPTYLAWAANQVWEGNIVTGGVQDGCPVGSGTVARYNVWDLSNSSGCGTNNVRVSSFAGWFTNTATNNYDLTVSASAAVGAGNPASFPTTDIHGTTRSSPPTAGAFQAGSVAAVKTRAIGGKVQITGKH